MSSADVPISDVDGAKAFYTERVGFKFGRRHRARGGVRIVQMTPPGSACSITIGTGLDLAAPGSLRGMHLIVSDIEAGAGGARRAGGRGQRDHSFRGRRSGAGPDPERRDYGSYADFGDPDGNTWVLQEVGFKR